MTLEERWKYEFRSWNYGERFGERKPVELVISVDYSELPCDMCMFHIFKMSDGVYMTVVEEGDSTYDAREAELEFFNSHSMAMDSLRRFEKCNRWRRR